MLRKVATLLGIALSAILAEAATIDKRIVGGQDAKDGEFPFMVTVQSMEVYGPKFCAGSLLNKYTVLTAAHCVRSTKGDIIVKAGTANITSLGLISQVREFKAHPAFQGRNDAFAHDIAMVILRQGFDESETVGYARLPASGSDPEVNSTAIAIGWGEQDPEYATKPRGVNILSKVVIPVRPRGDCWQRTPDADKTHAEKIVCAGGDAKNICKQDSGGPLIDQKTGHVIGITSRSTEDDDGKRCRNSPSFFTRVSSYLSFINENLVESGPRF